MPRSQLVEAAPRLAWLVLMGCAGSPATKTGSSPQAGAASNGAGSGPESPNLVGGGGGLAGAAGSSGTGGQTATGGSEPGLDLDLARWVDPIIGTGGLVPEPAGADTTYDAIRGAPPKYPFGGLTYPGAVVPFGMVALSPDVQRDGLSWVAGYNYYDDTILGFSHMKTSGNGHAFGHVLFVPSVGKLELLPGDSPEQGYRAHFSHEREAAEAGYYSVTLQDETSAAIQVELTATTRAGMHRYTFPPADTARVLIDLIHAVGPWNEVREAHIARVSDTEVEGFRHAEADKGPVYFVAQFSRPFRSFGLAQNAEVSAGLTMATGKQLQGFAEFDTSSSPEVVAKVGLSWVSIAGARANLLAEIPTFDFEETRTAARAAWNTVLAKVVVDGGTDAEKRTFYSALYHAQLSPFEFADRDGSYLGADGTTHSAAYTNYTFFSLWDAFRAVHPLLSVIRSESIPSSRR